MFIKSWISPRLIMWNRSFIFTLIFDNRLPQTCPCDITCHRSKMEIILFLVHLFKHSLCVLRIIKSFLYYYLPWKSFWVFYIYCLVHLSWWKHGLCVYYSSAWFAWLDSLVVYFYWPWWFVFAWKHWWYFWTFLLHILAWRNCLS